MNSICLVSQLMGTYVIKSNTKLVLGKGTVIAASIKVEDYLASEKNIFIDTCDNDHGRSMFFAMGKENIEIVGEKDSLINGQGIGWLDTDNFLKRPGLIRFVNCKKIRIKDLSIIDSPSWSLEFHNCEDVEIQNVRIISKWSFNNDGIVIDCCRRVTVKNCFFDTGDDCISVKTTKRLSSQDIQIEKCEFKSKISAFKIGTETVGDVSDVLVRDCIVKKANICALKIVPTDGGAVKNVRIENILLEEVTGPIFVANGERNNTYFRGETSEELSRIENVVFSGVKGKAKNRTDGASGRVRACVFLSGTKKNLIKNLRFENCEFTMPGGEALGDDYYVEEMKKQYPEYYVLGMAPAYGAYLRHIDGVVFKNVRFLLEKEDHRKEIVKSDVTNFLLLKDE